MGSHDAVAHGDDCRVRPGRLSSQDSAAWKGALASLCVLLAPAWAMADACDGIPGDCQRQVQAPINFSGWHTPGLGLLLHR